MVISMSKRNIYLIYEKHIMASHDYVDLNKLMHINKLLFQINYSNELTTKTENKEYFHLLDDWCEENLLKKFFINSGQAKFELEEDLIKFTLRWI